ncbi:nucleoside-diphosphate kinase [Methylobacter luteus]|uniref:nucleoside-diphosphate kinase n=1 Tax=Methylobacter luteus TaxID=415 RepID=UPI00040D4041|nr:nucleoside-diphosphate kinase [Methylobacter luteus]
MNPIDDLNVVLTPNSIKQRYFSKDKNYLRALSLLSRMFGSDAEKISYLWNTAALIIRPDAIAGHMAGNVFPLLREHGFFPCAVRTVKVSEDQVEALWKYQWNVATKERQNLLKRIMDAGEALYLLFRDTTVRYSAPATVHLTYLKGTARIDRRKPGDLRTVAGPAIANVFSYLHIADDPADLLREQALLFSDEQMADLLRESSLCVDKQELACQSLKVIESLVPEGAFSLDSLNTASLPEDNYAGIREIWRNIIRDGLTCVNFVSGHAYIGKDAIIPDDPECSLPLDAHLLSEKLEPL